MYVCLDAVDHIMNIVEVLPVSVKSDEADMLSRLGYGAHEPNEALIRIVMLTGTGLLTRRPMATKWGQSATAAADSSLNAGLAGAEDLFVTMG